MGGGEEGSTNEELRRAEEQVSSNGTMAWARHITGQDPNDLTSWDTFESIAVIPGSSNRVDGTARTDDELWCVVSRTIDGNDYKFVEQFQALDWGDDPNYCWFVDCAGYGLSETGVGAQEGESAVAATYQFTLVGDVAEIYGVPLGDTQAYVGFDAGDVNNVGGGVVGLPYTSCPFKQGQVVVITGTDNYDGSFTLPAQNDPNELQITYSYFAETLDGTERAAVLYGNLGAGTGRVVVDNDDYVYYGSNYNATYSTYAVQLDPNDGSLDWERFDFSTIPVSPSARTTMGLKFADNNDIYLANQVYCYRFDMDTNPATELWAASMGGLDMDVDSSGRAYGIKASVMYQYAAADGDDTELLTMGQPYNYNTLVTATDVHVDDDLGIVIWGGGMWGIKGPVDPNTYMYNLAVRTFDNSTGDQVIVDEIYESAVLAWTRVDVTSLHVGYITSDGSYIYVFSIDRAGNRNLWKYSWDGSALTLETSNEGIAATSGDGIFIDSWDNLVVVNNAASATTFYYYDCNDLSAVSSVGGYSALIASDWSGVGAIYLQGTCTALGDIEQAEVAEVNDTLVWTIGDNSNMENREVCLFADAIPRGTFDFTDDIVEDWNDTYTNIIAGINYYSILETFPLVDTIQYKGETSARPASIQTIRLDFYDSLGCNLGTSLTDYAALQFSADNWATAMTPYSGPKVALFPRGITQEPIVYLWMWDPIPMGIRGLYTLTEVFDMPGGQ